MSAAHAPPPNEGHAQRLSLSRQVETLLEECRIVLPGIQALFGFQLAVVFSERFERILTHPQQVLHLLAMALVAVAIALIMTPAAYHRQAEPQRASDHFVRLSTRLLLASMPPLAVAICLEFYLVAPGRAVRRGGMDRCRAAGRVRAAVAAAAAHRAAAPRMNAGCDPAQAAASTGKA